MSGSQEDVLRAVEFHHEQYIKNLRLLSELSVASASAGGAAAAATSVRMERTVSSDSAPSAAIKAAAFSHDLARPGHPAPGSDTLSLQSSPFRQGRRMTNERLLLDKRPRAASMYDPETDSDDDDDLLPALSPSHGPSARPNEDITSCADKVLRPQAFSEQDLVLHLRGLKESQEETVTALGHVFKQRNDVNAPSVIEDLKETDDADMVYTPGTYEIYDIGGKGRAITKPGPSNVAGEAEEMLDVVGAWEKIKNVNSSGEACGRMTILQEPTPIMLAGVHLTMQDHFDMDELFKVLVSTQSTKGKTKAFMHRAFESESVKQRSFFFVFRYHTVVGKDLRPAPWQQYDHRPPDRRSPDHIDIAECSSVLALSLRGEPVKQVHSRKRKGGVQKGQVYDTFGPWHLLSIQFFPDNEHSMRSDDVQKPFYNGPYAFLDTLATEYRDAVKRYMQLNQMITKLITPPNDFMFDVKTRDKLLFEDQYFTYSRRYFWAYTTLGVINAGINTARAAYHNTFNDEFWDGRHPTLWPHPDPDSAGGRAYTVRMKSLRHAIERAVRELHAVYDKNEQTRKEIRSLREQLFSGSSVKESRRAIEQGDNIKILTGVSMVFLPLTFVTSVFGITQFEISAEDWRFPVTMVSVCVPFFFLILVLQTRTGMHGVKKIGSIIDTSFRKIFGNGDRRHVNHSQHWTGSSGVDGGHGEEGKKKMAHRGKRPGGLKRTQSGFTVASGPGVTSRRKRWLPWRRTKPNQDPTRTKEGEV